MCVYIYTLELISHNRNVLSYKSSFLVQIYLNAGHLVAGIIPLWALFSHSKTTVTLEQHVSSAAAGGVATAATAVGGGLWGGLGWQEQWLQRGHDGCEKREWSRNRECLWPRRRCCRQQKRETKGVWRKSFGVTKWPAVGISSWARSFMLLGEMEEELRCLPNLWSVSGSYS